MSSSPRLGRNPVPLRHKIFALSVTLALVLQHIFLFVPSASAAPVSSFPYNQDFSFISAPGTDFPTTGNGSEFTNDSSVTKTFVSGSSGGVHKSTSPTGVDLVNSGSNIARVRLRLNAAGFDLNNLILKLQKTAARTNPSTREQALDVEVSTNGGSSFTLLADNVYLTSEGAQTKTISLPASLDNLSDVILRFSAQDNSGSGGRPGILIDNIEVTGTGVQPPSSLSATGTASPASAQIGGQTLLSVNVTPADNSTNITVTGDLSSIGGSGTQAFTGNGNTFTYQATVGATGVGPKTLPITVKDEQGNQATASIDFTVLATNSNSTVVISQVYGSGGNDGATFTHDYVELYNRSSATIDITGWSVQYASAAGTDWTNKQLLAGTIEPGKYYLVRLGTNDGEVGNPLPVTPHMTGGINISGTAGKIALVKNFDSLSGACPTSDTDISDFVGYGSTASCREGISTADNAPSPSATNAIYRAGAGGTDTDYNKGDFAAAAALPRATTPIVEVGPFVANTEPTSNGFNTPRDASISVNFSEDVDTTGQWYSINCVSSGNHDSAVIVGGPRNFVITPDVNFTPGEQCTVTIDAALVSDQDADDGQPNTNNLLTTHTWSFTIANGTAPPFSQDVHLTMGNPSDAVTDLNTPNNYLMEKPEFALSYNRDKGTPNWVSWHLSDEWVGSLSRVDTFRPDPEVPRDWYRVQGFDYSGSGFDRGHMVPNADRDKETSRPINQATFLMTNIIPQAPDNNQGPWANFENYLRTLLTGNELYVIAGGFGTGGNGSNGFASTIAGGKVTVPAQTWKVVLVVPKDGGDDVARTTAAARTIAILMPNTQGIRTTNPNDWQDYLTTVDAVENLTGYNFFSNLPDVVENAVEAGLNGDNPPGTVGQTVTTDEDTQAAITLEAVSPDPNATLNYIVGQPSNGTLTGVGPNLVYTPGLNFNGTDSFTFKVNDGNADSNTSTVTINVTPVNDAPVLAAIDDKTVNLGDTLTFTVAASDPETPAQTLTYSLTGTVPAGATLSPAGVFSWTPSAEQVGAVYSFTVRVADDGNPSLSDEQTFRIGVAYTWTGVLSPINADGTSVFKLGRTVPVKFKLTGASAGITTAVARVYIAKITNNVVGESQEAEATGNSTEGNLFRYDPAADQYIFNLSTKGLTPGTYQLQVNMGDGVVRTIVFGLN